MSYRLIKPTIVGHFDVKKQPQVIGTEMGSGKLYTFFVFPSFIFAFLLTYASTFTLISLSPFPFS
jgi:hypothetical protein